MHKWVANADLELDRSRKENVQYPRIPADTQTIPSVEDLHKMTKKQLATVKNFTILRPGYGNIRLNRQFCQQDHRGH